MARFRVITGHRSLRFALSALVATAALATGAQSASAATTVGSTPEAVTGCSAGSTVVQDAGAPSSPSYVVPPGVGVITSWSYRAGANPGIRRLKVLRPTSTSGTYAVAGESALETAPASQTTSFPTRIPVQGGELLAFYTTTGDACRASSASGNTVRGGAGDPPVGTNFGANSLFASSTVLNVSAVVEADGDGDGYGDESQDSCPADPTVFATPCVADLGLSMTSSPTSLTLGQQITYTIAVRNNGPTTAREVAVTDVLPERAALVSVSKGCTGFSTITCTVGDLPAGAAAPVYTIVIRAPSVGTAINAARVAATTPDPNPDDNSATATTTVSPPPFKGALVRGRAFRVSKDSAPLRVTCPIAARTCAATLTLTTSKRIRLSPRSKARRVALGRASFRVKGGRTATVRVPLSRTGQRVLALDANVLTSSVTKSTDAWDQKASRTVTVSVLRARRSNR